ncbi:MAG: fibronectin type III domain-containing protein [Proteobacteria bacterium]|nr:fibronectin type III domain-containing protein [Pseudomonadota bacterium]MBU1717079.1 fibronectin type III domain-containing protein [Pseudomonadota bacterium]
MRSKYYIVITIAITMALLSGIGSAHKAWAASPQVDTNGAINITPTSATLKGSFRPRDVKIDSVYFEYGTTTSYGTKVHPPQQCAKYDWDTVCDVHKPIVNLTPQQTYHFRLIVKYWNDNFNEWRLAGGGDKTFSTHYPPKATTGDATDVKPTSAMLHGTANPNGNNTDAYLYYSPGGTPAGQNVGSGTSPVPLNIKITGLTPGTKYSYYLRASSPAGKSDGEHKTFFTPDKPVVKTYDATKIGTHDATLNGSVNPSGLDTMYYFEYGETASYGITKSKVYAGKSISASAVSMDLPNYFNPGKLYHYRIVASNNLGVSYGADKTFTTEKLATPSSTTGGATDITISTATLNGVVNPHNAQTMWHFEYRKAGTAVWKKTDNNGTSVENNWDISAKIWSLDPDSTYSYKLIATNGAGTTTGAEKTFKTAALALPTASTGTAKNVTKSSATVTGTVNPNDTPTSYWFWYGTSTQYTSHTTGQTGLTGKNDIAVSTDLIGLAPNTTYYYRISVNNIKGSAQGQDKSFKTSDLSKAPVVNTSATRKITSSSAEISGTVNPNGLATTYYFQYGPTTAYGSTAPATPQSAGSSTSSAPVSTSLLKLMANSTYHYRLVAVSSAGTSYGMDMMFKTIASTLTLKPNRNKPNQPTLPRK